MTIELSVAWSRRFGDDVHSEDVFGMLTVDVPAGSWTEALTFAHDELDCGYFDWLTAVDELEEGFSIVAHLYSLREGHHLLVRTRVPREDPRLASAVGVYRGAAWHERETHEMFGVLFEGHPNLRPLLLPEGFEGHPLRKEFVLAARVAKPWPGAKEPGESGHGAPSRRRMLPPGVPADWGPDARTAAPEAAPRPARAGRGRRTEPAEPEPAASATPEPPAPSEPAEPAASAVPEPAPEPPEPADPAASEQAEAAPSTEAAPPTESAEPGEDAERPSRRRERGISPEGGDDV